MISCMSTESPAILHAFPFTRFYPDLHLVTWHPKGILDEQLADSVLDFLEHEESRGVPAFDRFTDFNSFSEIRLKIGHAFKSIERRRTGYHGLPVKSAFLCSKLAGYGMAKMYETLMDGGPIHVRAFRTYEEAAEWLAVPAEILYPQPESSDE